MLNEITEYELYLTEGYGNLLTKGNVENGLSGLRQVLTVLTRGFLQLLESEGISSLKDQDALCVQFLLCWLHEKYTMPECATERIRKEFQKAKSCSLLRHIVENGLKVKGFGGCERAKVEAALGAKAASWEKSMFFSLSDNSVNEIKFKAIIADALLAGPLTNKRLVIRGDKLNYGLACAADHTRYIERLLAIVGACLQRRSGAGKGAVVKMCELSNYLDKPANNKNKRSSPLYAIDGYFSTRCFTYGGMPILTKTAVSGGVLKVFFNEKWLSDLEVRLVDADRAVAAPYVAFGDADLLKGRF